MRSNGHRCILWDEASPEFVAKQRKLFQCGNVKVDLGQSSTGCLVYYVWLNDCVVVVCSNKWKLQLDQMPRGDAEWVSANTVYVPVHTSLFLKA